MSVTDRIGVGGLWITMGTAPQTPPCAQQEQPQKPHPRPAAAPVALVWRSVRSGAPLSRGRALTQQQAIHAILTHSRNEIIAAQTTPTRITYRTPNTLPGGADSVTVYEGTRPGPAIPAQPHHGDLTAAEAPAEPSRPATTGETTTAAQQHRPGDPDCTGCDATRAEVQRLLTLLDSLVDPDPCWLDHHGGCQGHGYLSLEPGQRCPVAEAKDVLIAAGRSVADADPA